MAIFEFTDIDMMFIGVFLLVIILILILSYLFTPKEHLPYTFSLIGIFLGILVLFVVPDEFKFYPFIVILLLIIYMMAVIIAQQSFSSIEEILMIDKKKTIWQRLKYPPELKERSIAELEKMQSNTAT